MLSCKSRIFLFNAHLDLFVQRMTQFRSQNPASTPKYNKEVIHTSLSVPDGIVRVVFATVALGMGINFQNVNLIIHYGSPRSIEDYFQESGRGGRSGEDAQSMIYWNRSDCPVRKEPTTAQHRELIDVSEKLFGHVVGGSGFCTTLILNVPSQEVTQ